MPGDRLVGRSPELLEIFKTVGKIAARDVSVLITGESGTGKELVARAIHAASTRADAPFVAVNTAAIPRELLESELFGHERGAFTGAIAARTGRFREAHRGTLFLDEIGDMPVDLQAKLLRVLQSGEVTPVGARESEQVDVRIIAATHRDLDAAVREGRFREDLLYRLRVVPLHIPPLRERRDDIALLAEHFVARYAEELGTGRRCLAPAALERLEAHDWPGNVRELENSIKRALVLSSGEVLTPEDFAFLVAAPAAEPGDGDLLGLVEREVAAALDIGRARRLPAASWSAWRSRCSRRCWRTPTATRSARPPSSASTATRCARRSSSSASPCRGGIDAARVPRSVCPVCTCSPTPRRAGRISPVAQARAACAGGAAVVQLRAKHALDRELLAWAAEIRALTRAPGALFLVNDRFDLALAAGADGAHLGQDDLPPGADSARGARAAAARPLDAHARAGVRRPARADRLRRLRAGLRHRARRTRRGGRAGSRSSRRWCAACARCRWSRSAGSTPATPRACARPARRASP